jgi:hypothetical protein
MNRLNEQEIRLHVSILGWLYIASNTIFLLLALIAFGLLPFLTNAVSEKPDIAAVISIFGTVFGILMVILAIPGLMAGYGLLKHKTWARLMGLVLGMLQLVNFPVGTFIGIYTLLVLLPSASEDYFAQQQPA